MCNILYDERMGLPPLNIHGLFQAHISHTQQVIEDSSFHNTYHALCQYRLCGAGHAYHTDLMLQRQLSHLNGRKLDQRQV
jgi:hypothetical protein